MGKKYLPRYRRINDDLAEIYDRKMKHESLECMSESIVEFINILNKLVFGN